MDAKKLWSKMALTVSLLIPVSAFCQGSPNVLWTGHQDEDRINTIIFNPAGDTVISGSSDRLIHFWRASDGALLRTFNANATFVHESSIEWLAITRDGSKLASCNFQTVKLWTVSSGAEKDLSGHGDWVVCVAFSPDGQLLASASFDNTVKIWRASDGALLRTITNPRQMRAVAFSPDGSLLAGAGGEAVIHLWKTSDWSEARQLVGHTDDIYVIAFSPDGTRLASGGYDRTCRVWNPATGALLYTLGGNNGNVYGLAFTPDGSQLAYTDGEGNTIRIHRVSDGARLRLFDQQVSQVQCMAFSSSGLLAYGRVDQRVVVARVDGSNSTPPPPPPPPPSSPSTWTLTTGVMGDGNIQINPGPNGPNGTYVNGTVVQLSAHAAGANQFLYWSGSASSASATISVTMDGNKNVVANFTSGDQTEIIWQNGNNQLAAWLMDGPSYTGSMVLRNGQTLARDWQLSGIGDLDGDGQNDFVFQRVDGLVAAWFLRGNDVISTTLLHNGQPISIGWRAVAAGDLNGDGKADVLFQHTSGAVAVWFMNGAEFAGAASLHSGQPVTYGWKAISIADFDNDGQNDILWHNTASGSVAIWFMNGPEINRTSSVRSGISNGAGSRVVAAGDFSRDFRDDILWQHDDGTLSVWTLNNGEYTGSFFLRDGQSVARGWNVVGVRQPPLPVFSSGPIEVDSSRKKKGRH